MGANPFRPAACAECRRKDERLRDLALVVARQTEEILRLKSLLEAGVK